jgi:NAD(P)-dependent dehydrogenase (short-subunit alcohol dehydrogenase family)
MGLLDWKFAVVTGAASPRGLGMATARLFAEHGATVAILDLNEEQAEEAARDLGEDHVGLACDVTDQAACRAAVEELLRRWGAIDVLVNNAGITQPLKVMDIEPEHYDAVLDVNLRGTLYMSQAVIPAMREQKSGSIVNLARSPRSAAAASSAARTIRRRKPACWA